ncbi:hypothetical protein CERZMDRAFT_33519 [Cercospora zeae-maydis SCOH1-5]|uniref:DSC E3 ubiquitin ligase complex subunit A n=1 Tax=Cercospora zeae-maydis SCOH1-5 TaxID=717836 RepID=A0A6A6FT61_9PEZI|nr:hypothetical protein CERZMDRAFT_33519 [Cercospora zeae-maydis SCOH1-5]
MADRRNVLLPLVFLTWFWFSQSHQPLRQPGFAARPTIKDAIVAEQEQLWAIGNSSWAAEWEQDGPTANITGFGTADGFVWDALPAVRARAQEQLEYALGDWGKAALEGQAEGRNPIPLYSNVTGYVMGKWKRSPLQDAVPTPHLNLTQYVPKDPFAQNTTPGRFERNVTGDHGEATIRFKQYEGTYMENSTTEMGVHLVLADGQTYDEWEAQLHGTYDIATGHGIFTTTSDKFGGIFGLPHFALSQHSFETMRSLLNRSIAHEIHRQISEDTDALNPWTSKAEGTDDFVWPRCELVVHLQQMATAMNMRYGSAVLRFLERELRFPTGALVPPPPDLHFSMLLFSPDCGFVLESQGPPDAFVQDGDHLVGPKLEVRFVHTRHHLLIFIAVLFAQITVLMRQMREASTPSTRSRISLYTTILLVLSDGYVTMALIVATTSIPALLVQFAGAGYVAFINVSMLGMYFVRVVWQVQEPERERAVRAENTIPIAGADPPATQTTGVPDTEQPLPGTFPPQTPAQPPNPVPTDTGASPVFFLPSDQEGLLPIIETAPPRNVDAIVAARMPSFGSLYAKSYGTLVVIVFVSLLAMSWPGPVRRIFFLLLSLCMTSYWIPQIVRNVQRNCRRALRWEFVIGQSILRLVPFAYIHVYKNNVAFAEQDFYSMTILVLWLWVQIVILGSQELIGPRWFVKASWKSIPAAYDYHPILREDEEGGNMPIGFSEAASAAKEASAPSSPVHGRNPPFARRASIVKEPKEKGKRVFDCAICMQDLEVPIVEAGASGDGGGLGANLLARRTYMVTPCRHIFHTPCLEGWMKFRLQCPICRETLPSQ